MAEETAAAGAADTRKNGGSRANRIGAKSRGKGARTMATPTTNAMEVRTATTAEARTATMADRAATAGEATNATVGDRTAATVEARTATTAVRTATTAEATVAEAADRPTANRVGARGANRRATANRKSPMGQAEWTTGGVSSATRKGT